MNSKAAGWLDEQKVKLFLDAIRQALLMMVDAIERIRGMSPTTAQIREQYKAAKLDQKAAPVSKP